MPGSNRGQTIKQRNNRHQKTRNNIKIVLQYTFLPVDATKSMAFQHIGPSKTTLLLILDSPLFVITGKSWLKSLAFYLTDKCLLDNCWGCQHVGDKGAVLSDAEKLRGGDFFYRLWRNSSDKCPERFQGGATVDLLNTLIKQSLIYQTPGLFLFTKTKCNLGDNSLGHLYLLVISDVTWTVRRLPWSLRWSWFGWLQRTDLGSRYWLCSGSPERKPARTGQLMWSGCWSGLSWRCPGLQRSLVWWSGC